MPEISPRELLKRLGRSDPPQLLDVRSRGEFEAEHLPGSVHVPITELRRRLDQLPLDKAKPVVAICLSAHRSIPAVRLLASAGYMDARQLAGGMHALRELRR